MKNLTGYFSSYLDQSKLPNFTLLVSRNNQIAHLSSQGLASVEDKTQLSYDSIYRIFSMTKAIVSTCLLQLLRDKKINVNDTLDNYFDKYSNCFALVKNARNLTELEKTKAPSTVNNALFVGSTSELSKLLKAQSKKQDK